MGQNQVALAMCILDTTRFPRLRNVARKPRYPERKALERDSDPSTWT